MTTQQDERAELIQFAKDHTVGGSEFNRKMAKIAALLEADAKGGEAECIDCKGTGLRDSGGTMPWGEPAYVPCDCQSNPQTQAQAGLEATDSERNRRIYDAATHAAAIAVFMTRMDAEHPDADDKGVSGWLEEAEARVKQRASQSLGATLNTRPQQAAHDDATLQALGWQRISCPVCGADGARAAPLQASQVPLTDEQEQFLNFLYGSGEFMGCWFDERHPTKKGAYWWRKEMRRIFPERASHGIGKDQG